MKEQTLVEMKNKVDAITRVLQQLIYEQDNMRTLSIGMMETIKLMPGYDEAIKQVTEKVMEQEKENAPKLEVQFSLLIRKGDRELSRVPFFRLQEYLGMVPSYLYSF